MSSSMSSLGAESGSEAISEGKDGEEEGGEEGERLEMGDSGLEGEDIVLEVLGVERGMAIGIKFLEAL